ncbi:2Fe-2S iron-sulfur cluster-binding protein [Mariniflexile ostreae]|uniref:2Fe-2S iron-sulfur cluster-binding protein n=1 Tax=Mariniflexile ostreae TaxID=1520892 RepID=A0ABV5F987_9FLAO
MNYSVNIITTNNRCIEIPFRRYEYPNLMELIVDTYYEDIGECLGRGLCGTCHVKLIEGVLRDTKDQTEKETLSKVTDLDSTSRLACQIMLDEKINNLTFKIITDHNLNT